MASSRILLGVVLSVAMVCCKCAAEAEYAECGRQAGDAVCLFGACCSKDGMCGRGDEYCGDGCQENAGRCNKKVEARVEVTSTATAECGRQAHDAICLFGACCRKDGMCGRGDEYCGDGCQENAGRCNKKVEVTSTANAECGRQAHDAVCLFGACCSKDGMCGRGDEYCGDGCQENVGRCNKVGVL